MRLQTDRFLLVALLAVSLMTGSIASSDQKPCIIPMDLAARLINSPPVVVSSNTFVVLPETISSVWVEKKDYDTEFLAEKIQAYHHRQIAFWSLSAIYLIAMVATHEN